MSTTPATTDPWHVPPAPPTPLPDLLTRYSPAAGYATIIVRPDEIELGDVTDHTQGLMVVTEVTRRTGDWTIGGYDPASPRPLWQRLEDARTHTAAPRQRVLPQQPRVRVRRPATVWARLAGHTKRVTAHNPVRRGWYTANDGWNAACSCGWAAAEPLPGRDLAEDAVMVHRAEVLTDQTHRDYGLAAIERLEAELVDVLPWRWDHGSQAQLRGLTTDQALTRLTPWARALGVGIEHMSAGLFSGDEHFLWVDSRPADTGPGPRLDIRAYPTDPHHQPPPQTADQDDDQGEERQPCGEAGCYCTGTGPEHADCACRCDCPRTWDESGSHVIGDDD